MTPYSALSLTLSKVSKGLRDRILPASWESVNLESAIMLGRPSARQSFAKALAKASQGRTELAVGVTDVNTPVVVDSNRPIALVGLSGCGKSMLSTFFAMQYLANQYSVLCLDVVGEFEIQDRLKKFCEGMPFGYTAHTVTAENLTQAIPLPRPAEVISVSADVFLPQNSPQSQTVCAALVVGSIQALCLRQAALPASNRIPVLVIVRELHYLLSSQENLNAFIQVLAQARSFGIQVVIESQDACRYIRNVDVQDLWSQIGTLCVFHSREHSEYLPAVGSQVFKSTQWLQVGQCKVVQAGLNGSSHPALGTLAQVPFFNFSA